MRADTGARKEKRPEFRGEEKEEARHARCGQQNRNRMGGGAGLSVALLGPPLLELLDKGSASDMFFTRDGRRNAGSSW